MDRFVREHIASTLPSLTPSELSQCARHRSDTRLRECVHLSNPGTGSLTLSTLVHDEPALRQYYESERGLDQKGVRHLPMHSHAFGPVEYREIMKELNLPPPKCYIMTVRDPVIRLQSGFRDDVRMKGRLTRILGVPVRYANISMLVSRLRDKDDFLAEFYQSSAKAVYENQYRNGYGPINGSPFLIPQQRYLRGLDCLTEELRLLCTERLASDWDELLQTFGELRNATAEAPHKNKRHLPAQMTELSAEDAEFIRRDLFPFDDDLHRFACGPPPPPPPPPPLPPPPPPPPPPRPPPSPLSPPPLAKVKRQHTEDGRPSFHVSIGGVTQS